MPNPPYKTLDTDFIVGTAILYFESIGYSCVWKHIDNNPYKEQEHVEEQKPFLQNMSNTKIQSKFKVKKDEVDYWKNRNDEAGVSEAVRELFSLLGKHLLER